MKKKLLTVVTLLVITLLTAQVKEKGAFEITAKVGFSNFFETAIINNTGNNSNGRTDSNTGFAFATTIDFYFNNRWSLRSGFSIDKMGGEYNFNGKRFEDKLNYFSIPINANWHFGSSRKWNLNFGLSPSFLTNATVKSNGQEIDIPKENLKSFQLGLTYGIGYKIEINKKFGILIDYQGFNGLTNFINIPNFNYKNNGGIYSIGAVIEL